MNDLGLRQDDLNAICEVLQGFPEIEQAIIFGSRAKGTSKNGSDVDLALKGASLRYEQVNRVSYLLDEETLMPYKFDVLHYEEIAGPELVNHIDRVGVVVYSAESGNPFIGSRSGTQDVNEYVRALRKGRNL